MSVEIGLKNESRNKIAKNLGVLLASSYILYIKTQNFHWNIVGDKFQPLHQVYEDQYIDLAAAVDTIAERIRALGYKSPGTTIEFNELSIIKERVKEKDLSDDSMIRTLVIDNQKISTLIREFIPEISSLGDEATVDLLNKRLTIHDKIAWMLRSFLSEGITELTYMDKQN